MIKNKVYQTEFGENGNCLLAVLATFFNVPLCDIPDLYQSSNWFGRMKSLFSGYGYELFASQLPPDCVCFEKSGLMKTFFVIGYTKRGREWTHVVLCRWDEVVGAEMIHDPHPSQDGILKGQEQEYWYVKPMATHKKEEFDSIKHSK